MPDAQDEEGQPLHLQLHHDAMSLAQQGDRQKSKWLWSMAAEREAEAALAAVGTTQAIFFRSAASLAFQADRFDFALALCEGGLQVPGTPQEILDEILEVQTNAIAADAKQSEDPVTTGQE